MKHLLVHAATLGAIALLATSLLSPRIAQGGESTQITIGTTVLQPAVNRLGINLGGSNFYDSGQMMKNLIFRNPGFEPEIYQSTIMCNASAATTCLDNNGSSVWPTGFWNGASFQFFYGSANGRSGSITNYTAAANG